jgi:hypothetical protein
VRLVGFEGKQFEGLIRRDNQPEGRRLTGKLVLGVFDLSLHFLTEPLFLASLFAPYYR